MCSPGGGKLLLRPRAIISYWVESHLESCQTSMIELACENNQPLEDVDYFGKKSPLQLFDRILNVKFHKIISFRIISKITVNRKILPQLISL